MSNRRYALLAASFAVLVACSGGEPAENNNDNQAATPIAQGPAATTPTAPGNSVQTAPVAADAATAPVETADSGDAGAPVVEPVTSCLTCSDKLTDPSAKGDLCAAGSDTPESAEIYKTWLACACGPCTMHCGADLCAGNPAVPSAECKACLGYAAQICSDENTACKKDNGYKPEPAQEKY